MLNGDVAKYRIDDLVRAGEASRASRSVTARRQAARGARRQRIVATVAALLPIPGKQ
jgi:hypothetical protein